jgi:MoaA/NifB/PqqE/SkfB family radical SAM enzyme
LSTDAKMACIEKIYSVSALVGTGKCNANCPFCAGKGLRSGHIHELQYHRGLESAIKLSARYGGWSLSLTSGGEPTCEPDAVTAALETYHKCASQGAYFPSVVLFTNGILCGDDEFCSKYFPLWQSLGLTGIAVSVHDSDEKKQADIYGIAKYPNFCDIFNNIYKYGLGPRCTVLLRKGGIEDAPSYVKAINRLFVVGFNNITSWPVGEPDGSRNKYTISRLGMLGIRWWLFKNAKLCHGHSWGGGVYDYNGKILRLTSYVTKHNPNKDFVRQLVVFTDGSVTYSWIREGALCLK